MITINILVVVFALILKEEVLQIRPDSPGPWSSPYSFLLSSSFSPNLQIYPPPPIMREITNNQLYINFKISLISYIFYFKQALDFLTHFNLTTWFLNPNLLLGILIFFCNTICFNCFQNSCNVSFFELVPSVLISIYAKQFFYNRMCQK